MRKAALRAENERLYRAVRDLYAEVRDTQREIDRLSIAQRDYQADPLRVVDSKVLAERMIQKGVITGSGIARARRRIRRQRVIHGIESMIWADMAARSH